jgi:hypothetical protein
MNLVNSIDLSGYWKAGRTFDNFFEYVKDLHEKGLVTGDIQNKELLDYSLLNEKRMSRIIKHGQSFPVQVENESPLKYALVITEGWCGDSAQLLPYFYKWSVLKNAELKIVGRDDNESLMNEFLTNGSRSVPVMIGLDENFKCIFRWGPRPAVLTQLVKNWKASGMEKAEMGLHIHQWYTDNKGEAAWKEWEAL